EGGAQRRLLGLVAGVAPLAPFEVGVVDIAVVHERLGQPGAEVPEPAVLAAGDGERWKSVYLLVTFLATAARAARLLEIRTRGPIGGDLDGKHHRAGHRT